MGISEYLNMEREGRKDESNHPPNYRYGNCSELRSTKRKRWDGVSAIIIEQKVIVNSNAWLFSLLRTI